MKFPRFKQLSFQIVWIWLLLTLPVFAQTPPNLIPSSLPLSLPSPLASAVSSAAPATLGVELMLKQARTQVKQSRGSTLFELRHNAFNFETLEQMLVDLSLLPNRIADLAYQVLDLGLNQHQAEFLLALLVLIVLFGICLIAENHLRILARWVNQRIPERWSNWEKRIIEAVIRLGIQAIPYTLLIIVFNAAAEDFPKSGLLKASIELLWLFVAYRGLNLLLYVLLQPYREQANDPELAHEAKSWYLQSRLILWGGCSYLALITGLKHAGYNPEAISLMYFIFGCTSLILGCFLMVQKQTFFNLLPKIDEPVYKKFVSYFERFYLAICAYTITLATIWLVGYKNLARLLFIHSWAVLGCILSFTLIYRFTHHLAKRSLSERLAKPVLRLSLIVEVWLLGIGLLNLLGINADVVNILATPFARIGQNTISLFSCLNAVIVMTIFWLVADIATSVLEDNLMPAWGTDPVYAQMISVSTFYFLVTFGVLSSLLVAGLDLSVLFVFSGALGIGLGFGLQGIARNFVSGLILVYTGMAKKGDVIKVGEFTGTIQNLNWKRVHLQTLDQVDVMIPTSQLIEQPITNWTYTSNLVRVKLPIGVSYKAEPEQVKAVLLQAADQHAEVLKEPAPDVWLNNFGESAINYELLMWVDYNQIGLTRLQGELNFIIYQLFKENQIEIPYPQRNVYIKQWPEKPQELSVIETTEQKPTETAESVETNLKPKAETQSST